MAGRCKIREFSEQLSLRLLITQYYRLHETILDMVIGGMFWCHFWQLLVCPEVAIFGNLMNVVTKLPKMATPGQATFGMSRCYHFWQLGGRIPPSCQKWQLLHIPKVANFCYVNAVAIFGNLMGVFQQVARNGNILT